MPKGEFGEEGAANGFFAHTLVNYVCTAAYLVTAIVAAEFGRAR